MDMAEALESFDRDGFLVIPEAIEATHATQINSILDEIADESPDKIHNVADILGLHDRFLDLIDLPAVLPVIQAKLGNNIWVNHSHLNINPPDRRVNGRKKDAGYGWHRDGGKINQDLPKPGPLLSIKIGFCLSDLSELGRGQTYVIKGSHKTGQKPPGNASLPETATPVRLQPRSAILFDRRMIHSIRSANESDMTRKVVFIQYAHRWMCPVDAMTVEHLFERCNPVRRQLLGLSQNYNVIDGAVGRSARYHPGPKDLPLGASPGYRTRIGYRAIQRKLSRSLAAIFPRR